MRPELVAEIRFNEPTSERKLRQLRFRGLGDDKRPAPSRVHESRPSRHLPQPSRQGALSRRRHQEGGARRPLPPRRARHAPTRSGAPLHLRRFADGVGGDIVDQKRVPRHFPDWVGRASVRRKRGGLLTQVVVRNAATLVYLAGQAIEPHVWLARLPRLDDPDLLVFDLDPPRADFAAVLQAPSSSASCSRSSV